jgi:hypothetical protein
LLAPPPNPQSGGPPLVGCPQQVIQYISSYPPSLEAFSTIRNLRTRHAVVTRDRLETRRRIIYKKKMYMREKIGKEMNKDM